MNEQNVCKSATYVKPDVSILEFELEGSILLTASGGAGSVRFGANAGGVGGNSVPGATNGGRWSSTTGSTVGSYGNNGIQSVGNGGSYSFK